MRSKEGYIENSLGFKVIPDHEAAHAPVREQEPEEVWFLLTPEEEDAIWQSIFDHINDLE
jgi:hypothetical protein